MRGGGSSAPIRRVTFPLLTLHALEVQKMAELMFPIINDTVIKAIPWAAIAPYQAQAQANHSQSLETLARRGGLDVIDAVRVMREMEWDIGQCSSGDRSAFRVALMNDLLKFERRRSAKPGT